MGFLKKHFSMYSHLPKEIYVLAFGKVMTSMGALIWPMLTLIMSEKLGLNGQTIGLYMMIFSLFMGPFYLLGGKLADKYNKKHIIVTFDLIGNSLYFVCAALPMSMTTLYLLAIASLFQAMEQPGLRCSDRGSDNLQGSGTSIFAELSFHEFRPGFGAHHWRHFI